MAINIIQLVEKIFSKNPQIKVQNLLQSIKGFKNNKQDAEITFYTDKSNVPDFDLVRGNFSGKTALIIWVDSDELTLAIEELKMEHEV